MSYIEQAQVEIVTVVYVRELGEFVQLVLRLARW